MGQHIHEISGRVNFTALPRNINFTDITLSLEGSLAHGNATPAQTGAQASFRLSIAESVSFVKGFISPPGYSAWVVNDIETENSLGYQCNASPSVRGALAPGL